MWIPLMDYAMKKGVSLSTLRRYIKANKIQYKVENGKYLLYCDEPADARDAAPSIASQTDQVADLVADPLQRKLGRLELDLRTAQEEIAELKMLIAIYEEQMSPRRLDN